MRRPHPDGASRTLLVRGPVAYTLTSTIPKDSMGWLHPTVSRALSTLCVLPSGDGFEPPEGWRRGSTRTSSAPDGSASVSLVKDPEASSPSSARLDAEVLTLARKHPGFSLVSKRALVWEDKPALGMVHVWVPADGRPREQQSMIFWSSDAMWTFAAKAPREAFPELSPLFATIAASIAPR